MPLAFFVLTQYRRVTDGGRTDRRTRCDHYYPRLHSVARVKISPRFICMVCKYIDGGSPGPRWGSSRRSPRPSSRTLLRSSRISVIKLWSPYPLVPSQTRCFEGPLGLSGGPGPLVIRPLLMCYTSSFDMFCLSVEQPVHMVLAHSTDITSVLIHKHYRCARPYYTHTTTGSLC